MIRCLSSGVEIDRGRATVTTPRGVLQFSKRGGGAARWRRRSVGDLSFRFQFTEALLVGGKLGFRELFDLLYSDDPDGGPQLRVQYVMNSLMKRNWCSVGLSLRSEKRAGFNRYWLEFHA